MLIRGAVTLLAGLMALPLEAQELPGCWRRGNPAALAERASPPDSAVATVDGARIKVCYSRPSARGRTIMGGLVPYGEPWRLGANEATSIHLPFAAEIAGVRVEPGSYSLYVIPRENEWTVVVNRSVERWGIPIDDGVRAQDVGRGTVPVERLDQHVEQLTLRFGSVRQGATELIVEWEHTRVRIPIRKL
ncbi:MAG: hypothetical protein KatS3mg081_2481 [Gemmatimonadales bacterium]|nr:MAG: hypothetical protein KatS3mg081_2481 [Gemmatimonadales bacterium]